MINRLNAHYSYSNEEIHLHLQNYLNEKIENLLFNVGDKQVDKLVSADLQVSFLAALVCQMVDGAVVPAKHFTDDQPITFSVCRMIERERWAGRGYKHPLLDDLTAAVNGVKNWNRKHQEMPAQQIHQHRFYAPWHVMYDHWSSVILEVEFTGEKIDGAKLIIIEAYYSAKAMAASIDMLVKAISGAKWLPKRSELPVTCIANELQQDMTSSSMIVWLTIRDVITHGLAFVRDNHQLYPVDLVQQRKKDIETVLSHDNNLATKIITLQSEETPISRIASQDEEVTVRQIVGIDDQFVQFIEQNMEYRDLAILNLAADDLLGQPLMTDFAANAEMQEIKRLLAAAQLNNPQETKPKFWSYLFTLNDANRLRYIERSAGVNLIWLLNSWKSYWLIKGQPWPLPQGWSIDKEIMRQRKALQAKQKKRAAEREQSQKEILPDESEQNMGDITSALLKSKSVEEPISDIESHTQPLESEPLKSEKDQQPEEKSERPIEEVVEEIIQLESIPLVKGLPADSGLQDFFIELVEAIDIDITERDEKKPQNDYNQVLRREIFVKRDIQIVHLNIKSVLLLLNCLKSDAFLASLMTDSEYLYWDGKWPFYSLVAKIKKRVEDQEIDLSFDQQLLEGAEIFLQKLQLQGDDYLEIMMPMPENEQLALAEQKVIEQLLLYIEMDGSLIEAIACYRDVIMQGAIFKMVEELSDGESSLQPNDYCQGVIYISPADESQTTIWHYWFVDKTEEEQLVKVGTINLAEDQRLQQYLLNILHQDYGADQHEDDEQLSLSPQQHYAKKYFAFRRLGYLVQRHYYQHETNKQLFDNNQEVSREFFEKYCQVIDAINEQHKALANTKTERNRLYQYLTQADNVYQLCQHISDYMIEQGITELVIPSEEEYAEFSVFLTREECLQEYHHFFELAECIAKERQSDQFDFQTKVSEEFYQKFPWQLLDSEDEDIEQERILLQKMLLASVETYDFCIEVNKILVESEALMLPSRDEIALFSSNEEKQDKEFEEQSAAKNRMKAIATVVLPIYKLEMISQQIGYDNVMFIMRSACDGKLFFTLDVMVNILSANDKGQQQLRDQLTDIIDRTTLTDKQSLEDFFKEFYTLLLSWLHRFSDGRLSLQNIEEILPILYAEPVMAFWFLTTPGKRQAKNIALEISHIKEEKRGYQRLNLMINRSVDWARQAVNYCFPERLEQERAQLAQIKQSIAELNLQRLAQGKENAIADRRFVQILKKFSAVENHVAYQLEMESEAKQQPITGFSAQMVESLNQLFLDALGDDETPAPNTIVFDAEDPKTCVLIYRQYKKWCDALVDYRDEYQTQVSLLRLNYYGWYFMFTTLINSHEHDSSYIEARAQLAPILAATVAVTLSVETSEEDKHDFLSQYVQKFSEIIMAVSTEQLANYRRILIELSWGKLRSIMSELQRMVDSRLSQLSSPSTDISQQDVEQTTIDRLQAELVALESDDDALRQWLQEDELGIFYADMIVELTEALREGQVDETTLRDAVTLKGVIDWARKQHTLSEQSATNLLATHYDIEHATIAAMAASDNRQTVVASSRNIAQRCARRHQYIVESYQRLTRQSGQGHDKLREPPISLQEQMTHTLED